MGKGDQSELGGDPEVIDLRGLDRRAALKRGAVVAGAALWATPVVQTVGIGRAAAQEPSQTTSTTATTTLPPETTTTTSSSTTTTTEPPSSTTTTSSTSTSTTSSTTTSTSTTTTTKPPHAQLCNIQIIVRHDNCYFGLLYDGHRWIQWSDRAPDAVDCIRFFANSNQVDASFLLAFLFAIKVKVTKVSSSLWRIKLPLPPGVQFVAGWAQVGDASVTGCKKALVTASSIDFSAS